MQNLRAQNNHLQTKVTELSNEVIEKDNESKQVKRLKEKKDGIDDNDNGGSDQVINAARISHS